MQMGFGLGFRGLAGVYGSGVKALRVQGLGLRVQTRFRT